MKNRLYTSLFVLFFLGGCAHQTSPVAPSVARGPGILIASVQYPIEGNRSQSQLLQKVERYLTEAHRAGATLIVFPELFLLDLWATPSDFSEAEQARKIATEQSGEVLRKMAQWSRDLKISILAGSLPRVDGAKIFNSAYLLFPDGRKIVQDKLFLTEWEKKVGWTPGRELKVFSTPWGRSAILICYDVEFPVLAQLLSRELPEMLFVPSMTESASGIERVRWTSQARAVELHATVVVSSTVGRVSTDWQHFGQSAFLTPRDPSMPSAVTEGPRNQPALVLYTLHPEEIRRSRAATKFFPAREQSLKSEATRVRLSVGEDHSSPR